MIMSTSNRYHFFLSIFLVINIASFFIQGKKSLQLAAAGNGTALAKLEYTVFWTDDWIVERGYKGRFENHRIKNSRR